MREIVLDTETTGLNPREGHRVIEIGCVELINYVPTGQVYHAYINPERDVPPEATAVSGITTEFLKPHPLFNAVAGMFLEFIGDSPLVIHNARFDIGFLNAELERLNKPLLEMSRAIDTVYLARKKFPGSPANLDALCRRFDIDLSVREKHGALLDAKLLAEVYLELRGGRQRSLTIDSQEATTLEVVKPLTRQMFEARPHAPTMEELEKHKTYLGTLKNPLWHKVAQKA
jgi:DNA polymerase-3 subunit epsilon